ncbi:MAG: D-2-hydroxyacid dehydrogenase [Planctomycetota bacterium]
MAPKIVVLDGYTTTPLSPGERPAVGQDEVTWEPLEALGDLYVYDRTHPADVLGRCRGAQLVLTNKTRLDQATIECLRGVDYIGVLATGVNVVDTSAAKAAGVPVCNVPGYSTDSVAQHTFALLLELVCRTGEHNAAVRAGRWADGSDFSFTTGRLTELAGKNLGIVGAGDIGQAVARIGYAMGMNILFHSRTRKDLGIPAAWPGLDQLFEQADVVSLHCPLTPQTEGLVSRERLNQMKRSALLINTSRGQLIDETALAQALNAGDIAGAGLDVLSAEPPDADNPLLSATNCIITPHVAWASVAARRRLVQIAAGNVAAFLAGNPQNVVNL